MPDHLVSGYMFVQAWLPIITEGHKTLAFGSEKIIDAFVVETKLFCE